MPVIPKGFRASFADHRFSGLWLGADSHGNRATAGTLDGFDRVLGCESSHNERQLPVGSGLDGSQVNPLHVLRGVSAAAIYFHNKFRVFHSLSLLLSSAIRAC